MLVNRNCVMEIKSISTQTIVGLSRLSISAQQDAQDAMQLDSDHFDVVVLGTGLAESIAAA